MLAKRRSNQTYNQSAIGLFNGYTWIKNPWLKGDNYKSSPATANFGAYPKEQVSLATHELRVYAQANDAKVYHYRDSSSLEVDAIVQKYSGEYAAFEIKLGTGQIDVAAANITKFAAVIDTTKTQAPQSLNIIIGLE